MSKHLPRTNPSKRSRRKSRGQAMVEYSMINWVLIVALVLGFTAKIAPNPADPKNRLNLIELFLDAYQTYYDSYYFVLNLPFP
jgi:hypothetical protein